MDLLKLILQNTKDIKKLERQLCCTENSIPGNVSALQFIPLLMDHQYLIQLVTHLYQNK
jgi:hypothetical protein